MSKYEYKTCKNCQVLFIVYIGKNIGEVRKEKDIVRSYVLVAVSEVHMQKDVERACVVCAYVYLVMHITST